MSPRRCLAVLLSAAAIGLALSGCAHSATPTASPTHTAVATPSSTPTTSSSGCAPTTATIPAGAITHTTIDVDGDGKPDTEWISQGTDIEFGVTTASGATASFAVDSASGAGREGLIANQGNGMIVAMVDDNRSATVHYFVNCEWVQPHDAKGVAYTFDYGDFAGTGSGVGCSDGTLVGWQVTATGSTYTVTKTVVNVNASGTLASNGATSTVTTNASASSAAVMTAQSISCGAVTVANGGVVLQ